MAAPPPRPGWLNRTVWGMAWTSFLSDVGHEAQSTVLPSFMAALGLPPAALGAVEGVADASASVVKLGAGWLSDHLGRRKPFVVLGYLATGLASGVLALAAGLPLVLAGKVFGWLGRGVRGPLRDAMLTDSIPPEARGRAFGFHRFGDTLGAIIGPLLAAALLALPGDALATARAVLWWSMLPGVAAALVFALLVAERGHVRRPPASLRRALREMPPPFRRALWGVGVFGAGDFAHTLLILAATQALTPTWGAPAAAAVGAALYVLHHAVAALAAWPAGVLGDRHGHQRVLAWGYGVAPLVPLTVGACLAFEVRSVALLAVAFALAGLVTGVQETLEASATAALAPAERRGLAFGLLGAVNGAGDLLSSVLVGALWTAHPLLGFGYAALCMTLGAVVTAHARAGSA
jgi:MFS family permease